ncbi:MAG: hypothetical protein QOJ00_1941 [Actinomycetota bacterium]|jgi:hypothetical protein
MSQTRPEGESTAEREGIVDQQDAALEKMEADKSTEAPGETDDNGMPSNPSPS